MTGENENAGPGEEARAGTTIPNDGGPSVALHRASTPALRDALLKNPILVRCRCGGWASFWCLTCDGPLCALCLAPRGFCRACQRAPRSLGALRLLAAEKA